MGPQMGNMPPFMGMMLNMILSRNPALQNNPLAQNMIQALMNGDAKSGEMLANNYLNTMGMTKDEALNQAYNQFSQFQQPQQPQSQNPFQNR